VYFQFLHHHKRRDIYKRNVRFIAKLFAQFPRCCPPVIADFFNNNPVYSVGGKNAINKTFRPL
jgi:hypothetical protein